MATKVNRETLKKAFEKGNTPKQKDFENLIDSMPNFLDDGAVVFGDEGFELFTKKNPKMDGDVLEISQYDSGCVKKICWRFHLNADGSLDIKDVNKNPLITLSKDKGVLIKGDLRIDGNIIFNNSPESYGSKQNHVVEYCQVYKIDKNKQINLLSITQNYDKNQLYEVHVICGSVNAFYLFLYYPENSSTLFKIIEKTDSIILTAEKNDLTLKRPANSIYETFVVHLKKIDCERIEY